MINKSNYEEYLVDYLHGELKADLLPEMEALLANDDAVAAEFALLQQTILEADETILFEDKASLYRKETPGFFIRYRLYFAAAAIITGILLTAFFLFNRTPGHVPVASKQNTEHNIPNPVQDTFHQTPKAAVPQQVVVNRTGEQEQSIRPVRHRIRKNPPQEMNQIPVEVNDKPGMAVQAPANQEKTSMEKTLPQVTVQVDLAQQTPKESRPAIQQDPAPLPVQEPLAGKYAIQFSEAKQPKLFRALGKLNRLSRKVHDTRQQLANTEIVVMLGNTKILNFN